MEPFFCWHEQRLPAREFFMQRLRVAHLLRELTRALSHTNLRLMRFSRGRCGLLCGRSLALRLPLLTDERATRRAPPTLA